MLKQFSKLYMRPRWETNPEADFPKKFQHIYKKINKNIYIINKIIIKIKIIINNILN